MRRWTVPLLVATALTATAPAAEALPTGVSITLADGVRVATAGTPLDYRVTLRNTNQKATATVHVELSLPVGAAATLVSPGGKSLEPWLVVWRPNVPAGGKTTVTATFVAGKPRPSAKGYTAQACLVAEHIRLACATDINQLPGAADIHALSAPAPAETRFPVWLAIATAATIATAAALRIRSNRAARSPMRDQRVG